MPGRDSLPLRRLLLFFIVVAAVVALDQWTKALIRSYPEGHVFFEAGFFRIIRLQNTGAAFGLFRGANLALMIVDFVAIIASLVYVFGFSRRYPMRLPGWIGMSFVVAGTCGNLIDRFNSSVEGITDFISIGVWPAFNVADSSITVGIILFAFTLVFLTPRPGVPVPNANTIELIADENGIRLDGYVARRCPELSRTQAQRLIGERRVTVNGIPAKASLKVFSGDRIVVNVPAAEASDLTPEAIPVRIVYEDDDVLVVDKPAGLIVHPCPAIRRTRSSTLFCPTCPSCRRRATACVPASSTGWTGIRQG